MTQSHDLLHGVIRGTQSTVLVANGQTIWIDPFQVNGSGDPKADILFITHAHGDHLSNPDLEKVLKADTIVVGPPDCLTGIEVDAGRKVEVAPGQTHTIGGLQVECVPAYNLDAPFHPKENNWVGYIITIGGRRIYHAGDTDRIPEMKNIRADVAMLPIGGNYTMGPEEAAAAVKEDIHPGVAVPIHYGAVVGTDADADRFSELCGEGMVQILKPSL